jgi:hypothetical protein
MKGLLNVNNIVKHNTKYLTQVAYCFDMICLSMTTAFAGFSTNCESRRQMKETAGNLSCESTSALTGGTLVSRMLCMLESI